jgi:hypothetical protein
MNFNVYVNKNTGEKINEIAKSLHRSRNSIINEALEEWLYQHSNEKWPTDFFNFKPIKDVPDFKALRKDLSKEIKEDPLA